ncbi:hypothetical protein [Methylocucumis oryzae]|uniref:hypothetical protein n=1 Tax=Methylocucumis oryzae TaxID=1632867 RepID=UPI0019552CC3|nr:hypothetical protein [Methylocucumis oryzae]
MKFYPMGKDKPHSRYIGEILRVSDLADVVKLQQGRGFTFFSADDVQRLELPTNLAITKPSPYTHTIVAYVERESSAPKQYILGEINENNAARAACDNAKAQQKTPTNR